MSPSGNHDRVEELVVEVLDRVGEDASSIDAIVGALCDANPEEADALRSSIRMLRETGLLELPSEQERADSFPETLGTFRLERPLGRGGMGLVFLAFDPQLDRRVALKLVRPDLLYEKGNRERFRREVRAVARLAHPNIVAAHAVGEEGGIPYLAPSATCR